jgi:hypothetical protein
MDFSFKLYLAEVEKRDVLGFANLLKKASNNQPVTDNELIDVIKQYDMKLQTMKTHQNQIGFANKNKRAGNQMATNLVAATKKPQYDDRIKKAATVPHFIIDLQKDIKGLTNDMIQSIKRLTPDVANQILTGKYVGNDEFTKNIVRYKDNNFVKQALENVAASAKKPKVDYSEFDKYVYVKKPKNLKDAIEDYANTNNTNKSTSMVTKEQLQNLNSINNYIEKHTLENFKVKDIFEGLKSSYPNAIKTSDGIKLLISLYYKINEEIEIILYNIDLANEIFDFITNLMSGMSLDDKELTAKFNELKQKHKQQNDEIQAYTLSLDDPEVRMDDFEINLDDL